MAIAFGDGVLGLLLTASGVGSPRLPVFPASEVFLEQETGPTVVAVREQHAAVELIEIGRRYGRLQSRLRDGQQAAHQGLSFLNQSGSLIGLAIFKSTLGFTIQGSQLLDGLTVPGLLGGIARRRGRGLACSEQRAGENGERTH